MYQIKTESFYLALTPEVRQDEVPCPEKSCMRIVVSSYRFAADAFVDVDEIRLAGFAAQLKTLYDTLTGIARLEEAYGMQSFLSFSAGTGGHIRVSGRLSTMNTCYRQDLVFSNEIDQTYLCAFANALYRDYGRYAE